MNSQSFRNSRKRRAALQIQRRRRAASPQGSPHKRAIDRLAMELGAREGLMGLFHSGIEWRALMSLVDPRRLVFVRREKSLPVGDRRLVPDLVVRCARTDKVLLVIEVWHTHAVNPRKKAAFLAAGYPWIEVRSWHVISRTRKKPLPILDWGGAGLPDGPDQLALFADPLIAQRGTLMNTVCAAHDLSRWSGVAPLHFGNSHGSAAAAAL